MKMRRVRLSDRQKAELEQQYLLNPNWTAEMISKLADRLILGRTKVYKWLWDRRKKIEQMKTN